MEEKEKKLQTHNWSKEGRSVDSDGPGRVVIWLEFQGKWVINAYPWPACTLKSPTGGINPSQQKESGSEVMRRNKRGRK